MRKLSFVSLAIITLCIIVPVAPAQEKLEFVQVLVRHGDREGDASYYGGAGQLTDKGKEEMYDFGLYLRQRYGGLLKTEFDSSETAFISSGKDRSINSASLIAYGLYEDYNLAATWSGEENVLYEPIPVRAVPTELDTYMQMSRDCPLKNQYVRTQLDIWMEDFIAKHPEFVSTYEKETGTKSEGSAYIVLQEEVFFNMSHGLPLRGKWMEEFATNRDLLGIKTLINGRLIDTTRTQRVYLGPMLEHFISTFEEASKKLTVYSGHDNPMYTLQVVLGVWDPQMLLPPPSGSATFMEAYSLLGPEVGSPQDLILKFWYRNDTSHEPHLLDIPSCPSPCTLSMFKKSFEHLLNVDFDAECQLKSLKKAKVAGSRPGVPESNVLLLVAGVAFLTLACVASLSVWNKRRSYARI